MKRMTLALLSVFSLALLMALSATMVSAGWEYEDCPPAAQSAYEHASDKAKVNWERVQPPANEHAWKVSSVTADSN